MVNKVRKADGSIKYPYQEMLSFNQVQQLEDELKGCMDIEFFYRTNLLYGAKLWGKTKVNVSYDAIQEIFKKYFPTFDLQKPYISHRSYHGEYFYYEVYVAFRESDREI